MLLPMLILLNPVLSLPGRNAVAADGELETQREVVTSMLLRCLDHPEVIHTLSLIMQWTRNAAGTIGGTKILMNFFFLFFSKTELKFFVLQTLFSSSLQCPSLFFEVGDFISL